MVSIPPFLILVFFGPWLFEVLFGAIWREAGTFSSILAVYLVTQFISTPLVNALSVFEKQLMFLMINIVRIAVLIIIFGISYVLQLSSENTILVYSLSLSLHSIFIACLVFRVIKFANV